MAEAQDVSESLAQKKLFPERLLYSVSHELKAADGGDFGFKKWVNNIFCLTLKRKPTVRQPEGEQIEDFSAR